MVASGLSPENRPSGVYARDFLIVIGGVLLLVLLFVGWMLASPEQKFSRLTILDPKSGGLIQDGPYLGSATCGACHPGEYAFFTRSGHARTLRAAADVPLARKLDGRVVTDPERPGVTWTYALRNQRLQVERAERAKIERLVFDFAFGSDHHATTFVSITDPAKPTALEHRLTHFAEADSIGITPGQLSTGPVSGTTPRGRELTSKLVFKCFGCHSTPIMEGPRKNTGTMIQNVSCERCHGPARSHVEAARRGRTDLSMPFGLEQWTAESQMKLCGQCHRHPSDAPPGIIRKDNSEMVRFQPVGLMQSKCYKKSRGELSCVTCHDPHARSSPDRTSYEASCLKCHQAAPQTICSVSPGKGCIDCHMPRIDAGQQVLFSDHWIRVRAPAGQPKK